MIEQFVSTREMQATGFKVVLSSSASGKSLELDFAIEPNPMAQKYAELVDSFVSRGILIDPLNSYWNFHISESWAQSLANQLQERIDQLKGEPDISMDFKVTSEITQNELNVIHSAFEKHLVLVNNRTIVPKGGLKATEALLQINLLVHRIENFRLLRRWLQEGKQNFLPCSMGFRFFQDQFFQLEESDFDCFEAGCNFGDLFCGYNTTGKNFFHCMNDGDIELARSGGVRPQRTFSTEGFIHFGPQATRESALERLRHWWTENNLESYGYKFSDKRNALGLIRVGRLVEPAEFVGKSHWQKLLVIDQFDCVSACSVIRKTD